jgi:metallo-beta-lactamase class B
VSWPGYRLHGNPRYPRLAEAYRTTFAVVRALPCDLLLTPHPDGSGWAPESTAAPHPEPMSCRTYADNAERALDSKLQEQRRAQP